MLTQRSNLRMVQSLNVLAQIFQNLFAVRFGELLLIELHFTFAIGKKIMKLPGMSLSGGLRKKANINDLFSFGKAG